MPIREDWDPAFATGHPVVDAEHRGLVAQCHRLADACQSAPSEERDRAFDRGLDRLKLLVREHFGTEALLLAGADPSHLEDHRFDADEFEYLVGEVATAENFDRVEIQRFLMLWCVGHIRGSAPMLRVAASDGAASAA